MVQPNAVVVSLAAVRLVSEVNAYLVPKLMLFSLDSLSFFLDYLQKLPRDMETLYWKNQILQEFVLSAKAAAVASSELCLAAYSAQCLIVAEILILIVVETWLFLSPI